MDIADLGIIWREERATIVTRLLFNCIQYAECDFAFEHLAGTKALQTQIAYGISGVFVH